MRHRSVMTTAAAVAAILFLGIFFPRSAGAMLPQPAEKAVMLSVTVTDSSGVVSRYTEDPVQISRFLSELSRLQMVPAAPAGPRPERSCCFTVYYRADMTFFELTDRGDVCWNRKQLRLFGAPAGFGSLLQLSEHWTRV